MNKKELKNEIEKKNYILIKEYIDKGDLFVVSNKILTNQEYNEYNALSEESEIYNNIQLATKILLNSLYGALGSRFCRLFDIDLAQSVTTTGKDIITSNSEFIEKYLNETFFNEKMITEKYDFDKNEKLPRPVNTYIDTDSLYLSFDEMMNKLNIEDDFDTRKKFTQGITKVIIKKLDEFNTKNSMERYNSPNKIFWDSELLADSAIFCIKKKYCAHMIEEDGIPCDKLLIKGLEIIRSSTPKRCRSEIKKGVEMMLKGNTEEEVDEHCYSVYKDFITWGYDDISLPKTTKDMSKWECNGFEFRKGTPQHYKGALAHNHLVDERGLVDIEPIKSGDKVRQLLLKKENPHRINSISYSGTLPKEFDIDDTMIHKKDHFVLGFVNPMKLLYESLKWKLKDYSRRKVNVDDLFE